MLGTIQLLLTEHRCFRSLGEVLESLHRVVKGPEEGKRSSNGKNSSTRLK